MKTSEIIGNSILILGYNREGQSVHRWLLTHYPEIKIAIADKNPVASIDPSARMFTGSSYLQSVSEYSTIVRSPGISPYLSELIAYQKNGGHITSATNIFLSLLRDQTVGVTGTKGKSTTASLIAHVLGASFPDVRLVGNIGLPMLDFVENISRDTIFVAELSSHQLSDARFSPHVAVLLGIVPEHLDYYPTLESYVGAKENITRFQSNSDVLICNPTSPHTEAIARKSRAKKMYYGEKVAQDVLTYIKEGKILSYTNDTVEVVMNVGDIPLLGNIENILAAISTARFYGISAQGIGEAIHHFKSLPHRLEPIGTHRGIVFYNDSLATIPEATIHALSSLGGKVATLIAGGYDRHLDFVELGKYIAQHPVATLVLFPDTGEKIWNAILQADPTLHIQKIAVTTMEDAVRAAYAHTPKDSICLLSPASASYNLFRDYADRGDQFRACVTHLVE